MTKIRKLSLFASFLGLWITSYFSNSSQIIVGFILILTFGILHGSNDLILIEKINSTKKNITYLKLLSSYLLIISIGILIFNYIPWLALLLFIIISGYHFGEQHWEGIHFSGSKFIKTLFLSLYGILILLLLFEFHDQEVKEIIFSITSYSLGSTKFIELVLYCIAILIALGIYYYNNSNDFKKNMFSEIGYLLILAIIFKVGSLIWSFAIYFIFWHSIPSLYDQIKFLHGEVKLSSVKKYLKSAFVYWLISMIGFVVVLYLFKDFAIFNAIFFSFLAAITFPHVFVIKRMYWLK